MVKTTNNLKFLSSVKVIDTHSTKLSFELNMSLSRSASSSPSFSSIVRRRSGRLRKVPDKNIEKISFRLVYNHHKLGLVFEHSVIADQQLNVYKVVHIKQRSLAYHSRRISIGDQLLEVNGIPVHYKSPTMLRKMVDVNHAQLCLTVRHRSAVIKQRRSFYGRLFFSLWNMLATDENVVSI